MATDMVQFRGDSGAIYEELHDVLVSKHQDYSPKNISLSPGGPLNGIRVRMWDKFARLSNLIDQQGEANNESLEDSFKDMANYAVIAVMCMRGQWPGVTDENLYGDGKS